MYAGDELAEVRSAVCTGSGDGSASHDTLSGDLAGLAREDGEMSSRHVQARGSMA